MCFAEILKELRLEKNLTHLQLAKDIGFSKAVIGKWERKESQPAADALVALARFFSVTVDYLLGLET